jgi:hypothetical protein
MVSDATIALLSMVGIRAPAQIQTNQVAFARTAGAVDACAASDHRRVDADRRLGHVRSRELRADGPPNNSSKSSSTGQFDQFDFIRLVQCD